MQKLKWNDSSWHLFNRIIKRNLRNNFNVFAKIIYLSFHFIHFLFYLQMNLVGGSAILRIFIYKVTVNPHYVLITIKKYVWHTFCDSSYNYFVPIYPSGMPLWHNRRLLLIRHQQSKGTIYHWTATSNLSTHYNISMNVIIFTKYILYLYMDGIVSNRTYFHEFITLKILFFTLYIKYNT